MISSPASGLLDHEVNDGDHLVPGVLVIAEHDLPQPLDNHERELETAERFVQHKLREVLPGVEENAGDMCVREGGEDGQFYPALAVVITAAAAVCFNRRGYY